MNLNTDINIKNAFKKAFLSLEAKEDLEHDTKMVMYRFLSEIEKLTEEKGINRKELAKLIGTSASYITQLYRGNRVLNLETIAKFQKVFNITFEVKVIQNSIEELYKNVNVEELCENDRIDGFWVYHKYEPEYNDELSHLLISTDNIEKRSA